MSGNWNLETTINVPNVGNDGRITCIEILSNNSIASATSDFTFTNSQVIIWEENPLTNWFNKNDFMSEDGANNDLLINQMKLLNDGTLITGGFSPVIIREFINGNWNIKQNLSNNIPVAINSIIQLPDNRLVISNNQDTYILVKSNNTWSSNNNFANLNVICSAVISSTSFVCGYLNGDIKIWKEVNSIWNVLHTVTGHTNFIRSIAVLSDGRIVSGSDDNTVKVWNNSLTTSVTLNNHTDNVRSVAVTNDNHIISGSYDKTIKIWEEISQNNWVNIITLDAEYRVENVAVMPDGRIVGSSNNFNGITYLNGVIQIWSDKDNNIICFKKGSKVLIDNVGYKNIENIQKGEYIKQNKVLGVVSNQLNGKIVK